MSRHAQTSWEDVYYEDVPLGRGTDRPAAAFGTPRRKFSAYSCIDRLRSFAPSRLRRTVTVEPGDGETVGSSWHWRRRAGSDALVRRQSIAALAGHADEDRWVHDLKVDSQSRRRLATDDPSPQLGRHVTVPPVAPFVVVIETAGRVRRRPAEMVPVVVPQVGAEYRTVFPVARRPPVAAGVDAHVAMGALQGQGVRIGNSDDFRQCRQVVADAIEADDDAVAA